MPAPLVTDAQVAAAIPEVPAALLVGYGAAVTALAEGHCGRPLALAELVEDHAPDADGGFRLEAYPVAQVLGVATSPFVALAVGCTVAGAYLATVQYQFGDPARPRTATGIALTALVTGSEAPTLIPFAPTGGGLLATVGALAAAIAAVPGWTATVTSGQQACPVASLRATASWPIPVLGVGASLVAFTRPIGLADLEPRTGRVQVRERACYGFGAGCGLRPNQVQVRYQGGFNGDPTAGPVTVPADLAQACLLIARALVDVRKMSGVLAEVSLGNTAVTAAEGVTAITPTVRKALRRYVEEV